MIEELLLSAILLIIESRATSFNPVYFPATVPAAPMCSTTEWSFSMTLVDIDLELPYPFVGGTSNQRMPGEVRCAQYCSSASKKMKGPCVGFNYFYATTRCDFFQVAPKNCTVKKGCTYYTSTDSPFACFIRSCKSGAPTIGIYNLMTISNRFLIEVFCDMSVNGGGYTFINPADLVRLTQIEIDAMFTDKNSFLMKALKTDATQPYGILKQLPVYQTNPLYLSLNQVDIQNYPNPVNSGFLGFSFLYFGFLPKPRSQTISTQGLQVNDYSITFWNCDANPNSYMAFFPIATEGLAYSAWSSYSGGVYSQVIDALMPSSTTLPSSYFMFYETHWGGCGVYAQLDSSHANYGVQGVTIGFR